MPAALPSHNPDDQDAKADREQSTEAQNLFGHREGIGRKTFCEVGKAAVEHALDNEDEPYGYQKIVHSVAPLVGAGVALGCGVELLAGVPVALPKYRKNSESGESNMVVPVPSSAFV